MKSFEVFGGIFFSPLLHRHLKLKLGVFLTGYTVATVTGYVNYMFITCLHSFGTIIIVSTNKVWKY